MFEETEALKVAVEEGFNKLEQDNSRLELADKLAFLAGVIAKYEVTDLVENLTIKQVPALVWEVEEAVVNALVKFTKANETQTNQDRSVNLSQPTEQS